MKLWVDDVRPAPEGYIWIKSVNECIAILEDYIDFLESIDLSNFRTSAFREYINKILIFSDDVIDIDYDAGDYAKDGDDYIKILDWLEENGYEFPIHIHSKNPVGVENIRRIIKRNGWREI
jgi:hypothetical protein